MVSIVTALTETQKYFKLNYISRNTQLFSHIWEVFSVLRLACKCGGDGWLWQKVLEPSAMILAVNDWEHLDWIWMRPLWRSHQTLYLSIYKLRFLCMTKLSQQKLFSRLRQIWDTVCGNKYEVWILFLMADHIYALDCLPTRWVFAIGLSGDAQLLAKYSTTCWCFCCNNGGGGSNIKSCSMRPGFKPETPFIVDTLFIILMTIASQSSTAVRKILIKRSDILFIIPILYGGHGKQIERRLHF